MQKTSNFNLNKPEAADPMRLEDFNHNADLIDAALSGCARVECGTYKGTGTYGEANPSTLTFGIQPKIVFIFNASSYGGMAHTSASGNAMNILNQVFYYGGKAFKVYHSESGTTYYTFSGHTLSWYSTKTAQAQMNTSGTTYGYIAIG